MRYGKKEFLELILKLAGCQDTKVEFERIDNGFEYTVEGWIKDDEAESMHKIEAQAIGFECVLGELLSILYDTAGIDFSNNSVVLFEK